MRALKILFLVVLFAPAALEAQIGVRPGQYEYTMEMDLGGPGGQQAFDAALSAAGAQKQGQTQKMLQCVSPEDVKEMKDADSIVKFFAREMAESAGEGCKLSNINTTGNTLTYTTTCIEDGARMTMNTEMTFSGDTMTASSKGEYEGRPISSKISAKRVGECPKY